MFPHLAKSQFLNVLLISCQLKTVENEENAFKDYIDILFQYFPIFIKFLIFFKEYLL